MSARDRMLLRVVAPVALLAILWLMVLSPKLDSMKSAGEEIEAARAALVTANANLVGSRTSAAAIRAQHRKLAAAGRAVPASLAIPSLLRQLERVAKRAGVSLDAVAQGGDAAAGGGQAAAPGVNATGMNLKIEGRYRNVRRFMTRLDALVRVSGETVEGTGRLISISSIGVSPGTSRKLLVSVETTVYTLQSQAAAAAATPAPGSTSPPATDTSASAATASAGG